MLKTAFSKKKCIIPFFTYGDPSPDFTKTLIKHAFDSGADIIEVGLPFSDPIADGPVIQASHTRALNHQPQPTIQAVLAMISQIKKTHPKPIVIMGAVNLIYRYGIARFFKDANAAGVDGLIIPDLPLEASAQYQKYAKQHNVSLIFLVSPICEPHRMKKIIKASKGFVYLISSTGTTGERATLSKSLEKQVAKIKKIKDIPVAIGFGIHKKDQIEQVHQFSDGAIIGSFFIKIIEKHLNNPEKAIEEIGQQIQNMVG